MWYIAGACAVVLLSAVAGLSKVKPGFEEKSIRPLDAITAATMLDISPEDIMTLSATQVNMLLTRLDNEEPPEQMMGAMCYEMMAAPEVSEYICPVCGEKTIYNYSQSAFIEWELEGCRRMADSINANTDFEIILDEALFCDFCSPDAGDDEPEMLLRVIHQDGTEVVNTIYITDLRKIDSFLQGNLYYFDSTDGQIPLHGSAERIRELLGLEEE